MQLRRPIEQEHKKGNISGRGGHLTHHIVRIHHVREVGSIALCAILVLLIFPFSVEELPANGLFLAIRVLRCSVKSVAGR